MMSLPGEPESEESICWRQKSIGISIIVTYFIVGQSSVMGEGHFGMVVEAHGRLSMSANMCS